MENGLVHIDGMFKTNTDLVKRATAGIPAEQWFLKPGEASNHLLWVAGHLVVSRGGILRLLGIAWETPWDTLFSRGAKLEGQEQYPGVEEIRRAWDDVTAKLVDSLANAPAEVLAKPAPEGKPSFDGKVSGLVAFLAFHETYHVGQVSYLRKWLGHGQTVG